MLVPYEGGPVVYCPVVYTSFWGASWTSSNASLASQLNQFVQDLMASGPWMNILTQYGVAGTGAFAQASFLEFVPKTLTVQSYEAIFQACINAGLIPEPANVNNSKSASIVIVFLDQSVIINGGGRQLNFPGAPDAGYHDSFTTAAGNPFIYAFVEFTDLNSICSITSHEFAEMITDPLYNAWTPDHAGHEIGDYCSWQETNITVSGRTWTVQKLWSDVANACVASAPSKITPIQPGPGGAETAGVSRLGRGPVRALDPTDVVSYDRVLPLPPVRFNHQTGTKQILDADMAAYTRKLFSPLRHHHLFHDFPGFLRQAATMLENRSSQPNGHLSEPAGQSEESVAPTQPEAVAEVIRRGIAPKAQPRANGQGPS
jgi:hypothetical protein